MEAGKAVPDIVEVEKGALSFAAACPREATTVTSRGDAMSFFIAAGFAAFSGLLYLASQGQAFTGVCRHTLDLCQHPSWPMFVAAGIFAFGLLFRADRL
jgi:hypothetical protein